MMQTTDKGKIDSSVSRRRTDFPESFIRQMNALVGEQEASALADALRAAVPVSVRRNPAKDGCLPGCEAGAVPWCASGSYLAERPVFTLDPLLHAGAYYVQEAASMFIEQAFLRLPAAPSRLLDLCAAPGGKSTLWRALMPEGSLLVANEPLRQRAVILAENMAKWGHPDVAVTNAYPHEFAPLASFFDVIAADVPCSGEGMFRKDEGAVDEWSEAAVEQCAERQREIIRDVWPALREGGYLVYSTCTFNRSEDEDNVAWICETLGAEPVPVPAPAAWGIVGDTTGRGLPVSHFFPHRARGEGFFLALLRKTSGDREPAAHVRKGKRDGKRGGSAPVPAEVKRWICPAEDFTLLRSEPEVVSAVRTSLQANVDRIRATVRTLSAGIVLAEEKGRKLVPRHELAMSTRLAPEAFSRIPLTREEALSYLRREALILPPDAPRGYVLAVYEGLPLGWLNNLGSRANNLYPAEWRIRRL